MPIGRFQVMAILQAARAFKLGLPIEQAESWGLNRAIFYAAAKRGFKRKKIPARKILTLTELKTKPIEKKENIFYLGDEAAYFTEVNGKILFIIGGKPQTPADYRKQIKSKFGNLYEKVWQDALEIIGEHPEETLLSQRKFYNQVYKPIRDILVEKWNKWLQETRKL